MIVGSRWHACKKSVPPDTGGISKGEIEMKNCFEMSEASAVADVPNCRFCGEIMDELVAELTDDESFAWLFAATLAVYDLNSKDFRCSNGRIKRWSDLADLWGKYAALRGEPNFFTLALHKIHWGIYSSDFPSDIPVDLIVEVQRVLQKNNDAHKAWRSNQYYRDAFENVLNQTRPVGAQVPRYRSEVFLKYIRNRTWLDIAYQWRTPPTINLAHYTRTEFVSAKKHTTIYEEFHAYEAVIVRLFPEAMAWGNEQWRNERLLYKLFKNKYGITMKTQAKEIDKVIEFLMEFWHFGKTSVYHMLRIESIPDLLMEAIWPDNTKYAVTEHLRLAYSRVKSAYTYLGRWGLRAHVCTWDLFEKSWLFARCKQWVYNNDLDGAAKGIKRIVFDAEAGIAKQTSICLLEW